MSRKRHPTWLVPYNDHHFGTLTDDHFCILIDAGRGFHSFWVLFDISGKIIKIDPDKEIGGKLSPLVWRQTAKMVDECLGHIAKKILDESLKGRK
jgi:hypothetical protein